MKSGSQLASFHILFSETTYSFSCLSLFLQISMCQEVFIPISSTQLCSIEFPHYNFKTFSGLSTCSFFFHLAIFKHGENWLLYFSNLDLKKTQWDYPRCYSCFWSVLIQPLRVPYIKKNTGSLPSWILGVRYYNSL